MYSGLSKSSGFQFHQSNPMDEVVVDKKAKKKENKFKMTRTMFVDSRAYHKELCKTGQKSLEIQGGDVPFRCCFAW